MPGHIFACSLHPGDAIRHQPRGFDFRDVVGFRFEPTGILVTDREIPFAGVIAFLGVSVIGAADPVLFLNPHQRWRLPAALAAHEQRVWTSGITTTPAARAPLIGGLGFVAPSARRE